MTKLLTLEEAGEILQVSRQTLYGWKCHRKHGADFFVNLGAGSGRVRVDAARLEAWIERNRQK